MQNDDATPTNTPTIATPKPNPTLDEALLAARANLRARAARAREERSQGRAQNRSQSRDHDRDHDRDHTHTPMDEIRELEATVEALQKRVAALQQAIGAHMRDPGGLARLDKRLRDLELAQREQEQAQKRVLQEALRSQQAQLSSVTGSLLLDVQRIVATLMRSQTTASRKAARDAILGAVPLDLNLADAGDLIARLPGINSVRAQAIISGRPWREPGDIAIIGGISPEMVEAWERSPGLICGDAANGGAD